MAKVRRCLLKDELEESTSRVTHITFPQKPLRSSGHTRSHTDRIGHSVDRTTRHDKIAPLPRRNGSHEGFFVGRCGHRTDVDDYGGQSFLSPPSLRRGPNALLPFVFSGGSDFARPVTGHPYGFGCRQIRYVPEGTARVKTRGVL